MCLHVSEPEHAKVLLVCDNAPQKKLSIVDNPWSRGNVKNVRRILWLKQHLYVMLVETPNLRRMRSIRCLSSTDIVHSAPKESTGDFVDVSRKVVDDGR